TVSSWPIALTAETYLQHQYIEELEKTFLPIAVDIQTGEEIVFRTGKLGDAIRASCSIPGVFGPTLIRGQRLVDGGVRDNVPASLLAEEGADFLVVSHVIPSPQKVRSRREGGFLRDLLSQVWLPGRINDSIRSLYILFREAGGRQAAMADVAFTPDLSRFLPSDFNKSHQIVAEALKQTDQFRREVRDRYRAFCFGKGRDRGQVSG
ncbi:MAG TPA: patatin-like phospholipase family protein, partial [bacterium]|nr:patatin-like phospholipase family protein [bacterium]